MANSLGTPNFIYILKPDSKESGFFIIKSLNCIYTLFVKQNPTSSDISQFVYGAHAVAFLDLLGHKEKLKEIEGALKQSPNPETKEKVGIVLRDTIGAIRSFRDAFANFFNQLLDRPIPKEVPKNFLDTFKKLRSYTNVNFQSFSDSTIIWIRINEDDEADYVKVLNSIHGILAAIGMLYPLYLSQKIPFRGGFDIEGAVTIVPGSNEIYGPALNNAYTLECKKAGYPRVLVGAGVIEMLDRISTIQFSDELIHKHCQAVVKKCRNWITKDEDDQLMVHFMGAQNRDLLMKMDFDFKKNIFIPMEKFITESKKTFESDPKLSVRYNSLKRYFDRYSELWRI